MMLEKAIIINKDKPGDTVTVMFNPEEYSITKEQNFEFKPSVDDGKEKEQFVYTKEDTLNMELFFDTTDTGLDVRLYTEKVINLMNLTVKKRLKKETTSGAQNREPVLGEDMRESPPRLLFIWGSLIFDCILINATKKFTMFSPHGFPVRATLSVTFNGHHALRDIITKVPGIAYEVASKALVMVQQGETLSQIAQRIYGNASEWRRIADANSIEDVRNLIPGTKLIIP